MSTINSVAHALRTIDLLAEQADPVGLGVISEGLGLPRATTLRVLATLIEHGYVWKQDKKYALTLHLLTLAGRLRDGRVLQATAHAALAEVRDCTGLTIHLVMLDGDHVFYVAKVDPPGPLPMASYAGWRGPVHATAAGRALLAALPGNAWRDHLPAQLAAFTERTPTSADDLAKSVSGVRARGYALDDEELMTGLRCVAIALPGQLALSASGPPSLVSPRAIPEIVEALRRCAARRGRSGAER